MLIKGFNKISGKIKRKDKSKKIYSIGISEIVIGIT
jgi:hypothetical protein